MSEKIHHFLGSGCREGLASPPVATSYKVRSQCRDCLLQQIRQADTAEYGKVFPGCRLESTEAPVTIVQVFAIGLALSSGTVILQRQVNAVRL